MGTRASRRIGRIALAAVLAASLPFAGTLGAAGTPARPGAAPSAAGAAGVPKNPAATAIGLVDTIVGANVEAADAATIELLRLSGVPVVTAEGDVVALPNDVVYLDATFYAELVPMLRSSVARGVALSPDQFAGYLDAVGAMPGVIPGDALVGGLGTWGKDPDSIPEEKAAAAAIRALSANRGEVLYAEADPDETHLDLLQLLLVMTVLSQSGDHVAAAGVLEPETGLGPSNAAGTLAGLLGVREARAATPCERLEKALKEPDSLAYKGAKKGAKKAAGNLIKQWEKSDPTGRGQTIYRNGKEIQDKASNYWSKGGDILNLALLLLGAQIEVDGQPESLHVLTEGGVHQVAVTATAKFESNLAKAHLPCYALAGINVPPNGPLSGFRIRWSITQPVGGVGAGQGKFLKVATGHAQAFQATGGGGVVTGSDGKSKVLLDVASERQPGKGNLQKGTVTVRATLDKDDFPFKVSDLWGLRNPAWAGEKIWELVLSAASRLGLPSQPVVIKVEYHDSEEYTIKGRRTLFAFYYLMPVELDLYTCEGLDGEWHGTIKFHGDRDFFGDAANKVFGSHFPSTVDQGWTTDFRMNLGSNLSTRVQLVGPLGGIVEIDNGWRALQRTQGSVVGRLILTGDGGVPLDSLAIFDGFDMSYPIQVGAPNHCPPGGLYFP